MIVGPRLVINGLFWENNNNNITINTSDLPLQLSRKDGIGVEQTSPEEQTQTEAQSLAGDQDFNLIPAPPPQPLISIIDDSSDTSTSQEAVSTREKTTHWVNVGLMLGNIEPILTQCIVSTAVGSRFFKNFKFYNAPHIYNSIMLLSVEIWYEVIQVRKRPLPVWSFLTRIIIIFLALGFHYMVRSTVAF